MIVKIVNETIAPNMIGTALPTYEEYLATNLVRILLGSDEVNYPAYRVNPNTGFSDVPDSMTTVGVYLMFRDDILNPVKTMKYSGSTVQCGVRNRIHKIFRHSMGDAWTTDDRTKKGDSVQPVAVYFDEECDRDWDSVFVRYVPLFDRLHITDQQLYLVRNVECMINNYFMDNYKECKNVSRHVSHIACERQIVEPIHSLAALMI